MAVVLALPPTGLLCDRAHAEPSLSPPLRTRIIRAYGVRVLGKLVSGNKENGECLATAAYLQTRPRRGPAHRHRPRSFLSSRLRKTEWGQLEISFRLGRMRRRRMGSEAQV
jgi:hypothetical protein